MKIKHLIHPALAVVFFLSDVCYAYSADSLTDLSTITINATTCKINPNSDLGVCVLNKTGQDLNSDEIKLGEAITAANGGYSSDGNLSYGIVENDHFLILESTLARIKEGDIPNGISYSHVQYLLKTKWGKHFPGCKFKWDILAPPYNTFPTLIVEKIDGEFKCHFHYVK